MQNVCTVYQILNASMAPLLKNPSCLIDGYVYLLCVTNVKIKKGRDSISSHFFSSTIFVILHSFIHPSAGFKRSRPATLRGIKKKVQPWGLDTPALHLTPGPQLEIRVHRVTGLCKKTDPDPFFPQNPDAISTAYGEEMETWLPTPKTVPSNGPSHSSFFLFSHSRSVMILSSPRAPVTMMTSPTITDVASKPAPAHTICKSIL